MVKVKSSDVQPVITEKGSHRVYTWKTKNLQRKSEEAQKQAGKDAPPPAVQITSFRSWEEVGKWYADLQRDRVTPTPEIRAKAAELTAKATTDLEKARALYHYVATEFRYIALSFGIGRLQPHPAGEVLANRYGDCKDKHTLLASLLQAAGIPAAPVLVNASRKIDSDVPSPAQFDHLISRLTIGKEIAWLDTTPELAPFGLLLYGLRDKQALLASAEPQLVRTPATAPVPEREDFTFEGKLQEDGTLQGKIQRRVQGDSGVLLRLAFRRVPQPNWKELVQGISYKSGFMGTVDEVKIGALLDTDQPFDFSYSYLRKDFSDWANRRITPAMPGFNVPTPMQEQEKSQEAIELGPPAEISYKSVMQLPASFMPAMPANVDAANDYAEYHSRYELKNGVLTAERKFTVKQHEVPGSKRSEWKKFAKAVEDDTGRYIVMASSEGDGQQAAGRNDGLAFLEGRDAEAVRLFMCAGQAFQRGDPDGVIEICKRVLAIDAKFPRAWACIGSGCIGKRQFDDAMNAFRKEMDVNPNDAFAIRGIATMLASAGQRKGALEAWRKLLKIAPDDLDAAIKLGGALMAGERYKEAAQELEPLAKLHPDNESLMELLGQAYLKTDQTEKGIATLQKAVELDPKPATMNDVAYFLAVKQLRLDDAEAWGKKAVEAEEEETADIRLADLEVDDLGHMRTLASYWDTLGWVYYRKLLRAAYERPKVMDAKFISGSPALRYAAKILTTATYPMSFPEGSHARLVRRGILTCSPVSGCSFVLFTVDMVHAVN